MAVHQIHGQAVTFTPSGCEDFCLMLVNGATEDFTPETSFCFQMPLFSTGADLLGSDIDLGHDYESDIGNTTTDNSTGTIGGLNATTIDSLHNQVTFEHDGYYFFKWSFASGTVTSGQDQNGLVENVEIHYQKDGNDAYDTVNSNKLNSGFKSQTSWAITTPGTTSIVAKIEAYYQDVSGVGTINYSLSDLETDLVEMWYETGIVLDGDTFYNLSFTNTNSTSTTVKLFDGGGVLLWTSTSDPIGFNKIFKTPAGVPASYSLRFEIDNFIDYSSDTFYESVLTDVSLFKQCQYDVDIEDTNSVVIATLGETHDTTAESTGVSYHPNIEYCLDTTYTEGCYQFRATNSCDGTDDYVSNCFTICSDNCDSGIEKQLSWDVDSVKCVGDDTIDGVAYPSTGFMWLKMDLQDPTYEEEREQYVSSAGGLVTPWTQHRETEILVIWPVPPFVRRTIATAMMDTFYIDGVAYQKFDDDPYSPLFSARHNSAMRITVAKVGQHTTSKNL